MVEIVNDLYSLNVRTKQELRRCKAAAYGTKQWGLR